MTRIGSCGNAGAVESLENQRQVFHPSHRPLEISQTRRDSHFPTRASRLRLRSCFSQNQRRRKEDSPQQRGQDGEQTFRLIDHWK